MKSTNHPATTGPGVKEAGTPAQATISHKPQPESKPANSTPPQPSQPPPADGRET